MKVSFVGDTGSLCYFCNAIRSKSCMRITTYILLLLCCIDKTTAPQVTLRLVLETLHFTVFHHLCYWGVILLWFVWSFSYATVDPVSMGWNLAGYYWSFINISSMLSFWLTIPLVTVTCLLPKYTWKSYKELMDPPHVYTVRQQIASRVKPGCCASIPPMDPDPATEPDEAQSASLSQNTSAVSAVSSSSAWFRGSVMRNFQDDQSLEDESADRINVQDLVLGLRKSEGSWFGKPSPNSAPSRLQSAAGEHQQQRSVLM